jgi:hypothetical protein
MVLVLSRRPRGCVIDSPEGGYSYLRDGDAGIADFGSFVSEVTCHDGAATP